MSEPKPIEKKKLEDHPTTNFFAKKIKAFIVFLIYMVVGKK